MTRQTNAPTTASVSASESVTPPSSRMPLANRTQHLSHSWSVTGLSSAQDIDLDAVRAEIADQAAPALLRRLSRQAAQWSELDEKANIRRLEKLIDGLATDENGHTASFASFQQKVENELAGFVVTAHPTFAQSADVWAYAKRYFAAVGTGQAEPGGVPAQVMTETSPTLDQELAFANEAITHVRTAMRTVFATIFNVAQAHYPSDFKGLRPRLMTMASWVGFDLDGRTDIDWSMGLLFRYETALEGVDLLIRNTAAIAADGDAADHLKTVSDALERLQQCFTLGTETLRAHQKTKADMGRLNRLAVDNREKKETASKAIETAFDALLSSDLPFALWRDIAVLETEWRSVGIALSHIHFRVNAAQLHNAIGPDINLTKSPDASAMRRHYLAAISEKLRTVEPETIHYGTLSHELTTAKRVFMMAAQFQKHFDARTKIRMLVAESDTPFTLLTALYYAKLFSVEDYVEISPLFETAIGLQRGDRVIAELLDNPDFTAYIKAQKRFCVQLGFSDSGRYVGQPAAGLAIERFKLRLIRLWNARGLQDVQLLFFDTHGESIGRGAHPDSLVHRFLYTHSMRVRKQLQDMGMDEKHEVSFQGGEGFLWFTSPATALATMTDFLDTRLGNHDIRDDPFYQEKGWSLDFFLSLVEYQEHLADHKGYIRLIDSIGRSLLYSTGSRAVKRQGPGGGAQRLERVSQIRAIPHNAVMQQLGYFANSCGGLGTAIMRSPDLFAQLLPQSKRLERVIRMAAHAHAKSDIAIMEAYARILNPGYWLDRADMAEGVDEREKLRRLSKMMENVFSADEIEACVRKLKRDDGVLRDITASLPDDARKIGVVDFDPEPLQALHRLRLGLVQYIFLLAMDVPRFSTRLDVSLEEIVVQLLHLEVPEAVARLRVIFPEAPLEMDDDEYGEDASYIEGSHAGYADLHRQVLDRLEDTYDLVLRLSALIALEVGAFG